MAFRLSNFLGDPFAISTVSFGVIAWIIAIAGAASSDNSVFPRFTWWGLVYQIILVLAIFILYLHNTIELYKFTLVGLLAVAFLYTTNSTNQLIYQSQSPSMLCCGAGCILLSMLNILWILYFGGHPESPTNQFIDSFSMKNNGFVHDEMPEHKDDHEYVVARAPSAYRADSRHSQLTNNPQGYMSLSQLNGMENFSNLNVRDVTTNLPRNNTLHNDAVADTNNFSMSQHQFRYRARALYSYEANPDDINEISFAKDEILEVDDIDGKWWQARGANGQVGICPLNYVKLID